MTIAIASKQSRGSLRNRHARIEIIKGFVLKTMVMSESGARGAAELNNAKAEWPIITRVTKDHF